MRDLDFVSFISKLIKAVIKYTKVLYLKNIHTTILYKRFYIILAIVYRKNRTVSEKKTANAVYNK